MPQQQSGEGVAFNNAMPVAAAPGYPYAMTHPGAAAGGQGMSFIMQATQAVSPYKPANYHVTPSPQQHTYMPPVHAYGYHYGNQGLGVGAHSPMTPSQRSSFPTPAPVAPSNSVATPATSGTKRSSAKGKKSVTKSKPAKKTKATKSTTKATKSATKQTKSKAKKSNVAIYDRAEKSLGNLAKAFMDVFADKPIAPVDPLADAPEGSTLSIDDVSDALQVERRRIYDIINILESVQIVTRSAKNTYRWHGEENLAVFFAQSQQECFNNDPEECKRNGILKDNTYRSDHDFVEDEFDEKKEKSLGKISVNFIRLFLLGNVSIDLTEVSDRILGSRTALNVPEGHPKKAEADKRAAKALKTKIRRLYDVANVLQSIGVVAKKNSGGSYSSSKTCPCFKWTFRIHPKNLSKFLAKHEESYPPPRPGTGVSASAKKMLKNINQTGAVDESVMDDHEDDLQYEEY